MYGFGGLGEVEVEIWLDVTMAGRTDDKKGKIGLLSQWTMEGWDEQFDDDIIEDDTGGFTKLYGWWGQ